MYDLIYGGNEYIAELKQIFPTAKFTDASDEVHEDRIAIDVHMDEKEFWKKICLNGFMEMTLGVRLACLEKTEEFNVEWESWKKTNPECFNSVR